MQRKQILYLLAIVALLVSMLPISAAAQDMPPATWQIEEYTPTGNRALNGAGASGAAFPLAADGMSLFNETEPNDTVATANALPGNQAVVLGNISPANDVDYFSFTAQVGDRVYAAMQTQWSNASGDSRLQIIGSDGLTVLEFDDDDGVFSGFASSIAGTIIPAAGTYYVRAYGYSATTVITPYHLHVRVQSGTPAPEVEPNNDLATANPLPANGWVSGNISAIADPDFFAFSLNAGDSVYLGLDMDPERAPANTNWNGRLAFGIFNNFLLLINDGSTTKPHSEAFFMTVQEAGIYYAYVDSASATGLGANARYNLSVSIYPKQAVPNCTTFTSTDVPKTIGPGVGTSTSTIVVPGTVTSSISDINATIVLTHSLMADLDVTLVGPTAASTALFTDIGSTAIGGQTVMDVGLDDQAALPIGPFFVVKDIIYQPEQPGRLATFNGTPAAGTWTLQLADDLAANGGVLQSWSLEICGTPPPAYAIALNKTVGTEPAVCATGDTLTVPAGGATVYYCYTVRNTGLNTLTTHGLVDSQLGTLLDGVSYSLAPGATYSFIQPATVNATVTNSATWTAGDGVGSASASDTATVTVLAPRCSAGYRDVPVVIAGFDTGFPPAGWTVTNTSTGCVAPGVPQWTNTNPGNRANLTGGAGLFAIADSDRCGSASTMDTLMSTGMLDMTGLTDPRVRFNMDYDDLTAGGTTDSARLEASTDGGVTWTAVRTWDADARGPLVIDEALPGAGENDVLVRWNYHGVYAWWWQVDTAMVTACEPLVPAISLAKTVGTDPLTCAVTDQITLPPGGGDVTYCYSVENTGEVTLNFHDLVDSELYSLLAGYPYALAPGASVFVTETTSIAVTTVNTATWTAYNAQGPSVQATDAATVTVTAAAPAIALTKTVGVDPLTCAETDNITVPAGTDVTYCYSVENTGNVTLNFHDLVDSELDSLLAGYPYALAPGASVFVTETTNIAVTTVNTATWTAYNDDYTDLVTATDAATVTVQAAVNPAINLVKTVGTVPGVCAAGDNITVTAGTQVYYCYQVENTGNVTFNFHDLVDSALGVILNDLPYLLAPGGFSPVVIVPATPVATVTNVGTWTAMTALAGYTVDDTIPFNWQDISGTGTAVALTDDSVSSALPIGFSFDFFGIGYLNAYAGSNGFMTFTSTTNSGCCSGQALPNPAAPNNLIAGWWEDLNLSGGGTVHYQTLGSAPNRVFILQFTNVPHYSSGNLVTMQWKLFETSNVIEVHYQAAPSDGGTHSAGIENAAGTVGVQYYYGTSALPTPLAVRYSLTTVQSATDTDTATVTVQVPNIDVDPLSYNVTHASPQITTAPITITNTGQGNLVWNIAEEPTAVRPAPLTGGDASVAQDLVDPSDLKPQGQSSVAAPLSAWRAPEAVLYDNGPLITHPGAGAGGANVSALQTALGLGTFGAGNQVAAGNRVADDFTVTGGGWLINTMTFFGYQTGSSTTSTFTALNLRIWDGPPNLGTSNVVFGDTTTNRLASSAWSNIYRTLDTALTASDRPVMALVATVNTFLPAGTYWVDWQADGTLASGPWAPPISIVGQTTTGNAWQFTSTGWAALVDGTFPQGLPFIVEGLADCSNLSEVPWLSVSPTNGVNAGGINTVGTVTFNSTGLSNGTYTARLCVFSNDRDTGPGNGTGLVIVPVTLNLQGAAGISLVKTVGTTPGVCAATSSITVLAGTTVYYCYTVTNTGSVALNLHTLVDDPLGMIFSGLNYALAPGSSVNTVQAGLSIPAVINATTTNVGTWTAYNTGGPTATATATATVTATPRTPNIDVDPLSLSSTQAPTTITQQTLNVGNTGTANLTWAIAEEPASVLAQPNAASPALPASAASDTASRGAPSGGPAPIEYSSPADFSEGFDDITVLPGWFFQNNSAPLGLTDWFQGNDTVFPAQAGAATAYIGANFNNTSGVGTISNWLLTPQLNLANGDTFSFWTRSPTGSTYPDRLELRLSLAGASTNVGTLATDVGDFTTLLLSVNPTLAQGGYPGVWTQYTATLSGIPGGATGRFAFRYFVTGGGPSGANSDYIGIDTVEYVSAGLPQVCDAPADVLWLSVDLTNGTTLPANTTQVQVTFDSAGLAAGTYNANLCVTSNDPDPGPGNETELVIVPVELVVTEPSAPAIELVKTVGTTPGVCAPDSNITVPAGTAVYYCYTVTNTGDVTLNLHDLVDDQLDMLFTGFPYALTPGSSVSTVDAGLTFSAIINAPTLNTATWTAYNVQGLSATATATAFVDVIYFSCQNPIEDFEAGVPPLGWSVVNNVPGGPTWGNIASCGPNANGGNFTGGAGDAACMSASTLTAGAYDAELRSPLFSLVGYSDSTVSYLANYQNWAGIDRLNFDISSDGGATWANLRTWTTDQGAFQNTPGVFITIDLAAYLGQSNLMVRWHYFWSDPAALGWYAQIDEAEFKCVQIPPTAVTLDSLSATPAAAAGSLSLLALPAVVSLALGAAYALRRRQD